MCINYRTFLLMYSSYKHMTMLHFDTDFLSWEFQLVCVSANDQLNTPGFHTYKFKCQGFVFDPIFSYYYYRGRSMSTRGGKEPLKQSVEESVYSFLCFFFKIARKEAMGFKWSSFSLLPFLLKIVDGKP